MPSPATPRRPSNRGGSAKSTPTKPLDIGQPLGTHDTNSVRARVRKWQQQGGGVVAIDDIYAGGDDENVTKVKFKSGKVRIDRPEKVDRPRKVDRPEKVDRPKKVDRPESVGKDVSPAPMRKRSHSTPKKRVISDEHWKRTRASTQTPSRNLPAPKRISEYTSNDETGSPRAKREARKDEKDKGNEHPRSGASRSSGAASTSPAREGRYATPRKKVESVTASDVEADNSKSMPLSDDPEMLRRPSPPPDTEWASSEADFSELSRRRARGLSQPARGHARPPRGGIFAHMIDESKKMFARPEPEPPERPPANRGSKIEAWLSETPDPFVDNGDSNSNVPAKAARARRSHRPTDGDPGRAPEAEPSLHADSRPKSSHSRPSKEENYFSPTEKARKGQARDATLDSKRASLDRNRKISPGSRDKPARGNPYEESVVSSDSEMTPFSDGSEVSGHNAPVPLGRKRPFPSTGQHKLSTIASVETLSTRPEGPASASKKAANTAECDSTLAEEGEEAEKEDHFDPDSLPAVSSQLQRRLTTHKDLMSVLSVPATRSRSIRSARSIRTNKSRLARATVGDLLNELCADEVKFMRELKTLVGGVIPVLLTCVLSRSDSAVAAGLFRPSTDPQDDVSFSKPIVNMGVAIERLKSLHKRIPLDNVDALLTWAQGAQRVYHEYLKAWRLGFKDVVVNLAPLEGEASNNADTKSLDEGLERDASGDVVDSNGEKVDVAYLLKRPLVRLKYLAKTLKGINTLQPSSKAEEVTAAYQSLVEEARKRARDERARLEDESAANIDPTRARDPMTLGVLRGVTVDPNRRVRARDFFNLSFYHSSGQLVDCRAELLYRDSAPNQERGGDLLICEIDHSDRWLLFPPMDLRCISARSGDAKGEIVVMLRSAPGEERYWQELISLRVDEEEIGLEWIQLLGSDPVPPSICRSQSFISRAKQHKARKPASSDSPPRPNPSDVDIPIGEKATSKRRSLTPKEQYSESSTVSSSATEARSSVYSTVTRETDYTTGGSELSVKPSRPNLPLLPSTDPRNAATSGEKTPPTGLKRSKAQRHSRYGDSPASETASPKTAVSDKAAEPSSTSRRFYGEGKDPAGDAGSPREKPSQKSPAPESPESEYPRVSSVPSADLPLIPKIRSPSSQTHLSTPVSPEPEEEEDYLPLDSLPDRDVPETPTKAKRRPRRQSKNEDVPPPPPPHRSPSPAAPKLSTAPVLSPTGARIKRRGSSPLKHEYEPSTASDSYSDSDSDADTVRHYTYSSSDYSRSISDSDDYSSASEDEYHALPKPRAYDSATSDASSLSPSNSVSQGGYRTVPLQPTKSSKVVASVFTWSEKGTWESVLPDECSVTVSPGLIEAFKKAEEPQTTSPDRADKSRSSRPLVSLELTPLVPIRRGTAIDISIRSPPTERSKITSSNNIMFRSSNPEECDTLYGLINQARINNPTYIALQNARGPFTDQLPTFEPATKSGGGWLGWPRRRRSYRASSSPRSLADASESSVGTMSSAFSALKRFGAGSRMFNIARSTVTSRTGREGSTHSGSADSFTPSRNSGIGRIAAAIKGADGIGLSNAKIRLYVRETASKWRDLGAARLTIMPAPPKNSSRPGTAVSGRSDSSAQHGDGPDTGSAGSPSASGASSPHREVEPEKRILIRGKTRGEVLLDVCLGESSFERVARTGIAVSVWEENAGGTVAKKGGVTGGSQRIYMIQMKSEAEAAYTFGLVGKLRY